MKRLLTMSRQIVVTSGTKLVAVGMGKVNVVVLCTLDCGKRKVKVDSDF